MVTEEHKNGVGELYFLPRGFHEIADRPIQIAEGIVFGLINKPVFLQRGVIHLTQRERADIGLGNGIRAMVGRRLDNGKERFVGLFEHGIGFHEQVFIGNSPDIDYRRLEAAFFVNLDIVDVLLQQAADIGPGGGGADEVVLVIALEAIDQQVLLHGFRVAAGCVAHIDIRHGGEPHIHRACGAGRG